MTSYSYVVLHPWPCMFPVCAVFKALYPRLHSLRRWHPDLNMGMDGETIVRKLWLGFWSLHGAEQPFTVLLMQIQGQKFKWHLSLTHCHSEATFLWRKPGNTHLRFCTLVLLIVMNNTGAFIAYVIWFECHFLCWLIESRRKGECEVLQRFDYLAALLCNSLSTAVAWLVCVCRFARPLITLICFFWWFGC